MKSLVVLMLIVFGLGAEELPSLADLSLEERTVIMDQLADWRSTAPGVDGRPDWMDMTREQRLARLREMVVGSSDGLRIVTESSLIWLEPVVGKSYIESLAAEVAKVPEALLEAGPAKRAETKRIIAKMGGNPEAVDDAIDDMADRLLQSLDRISDPSFIGDALLPADGGP